MPCDSDVVVCEKTDSSHCWHPLTPFLSGCWEIMVLLQALDLLCLCRFQGAHVVFLARACLPNYILPLLPTALAPRTEPQMVRDLLELYKCIFISTYTLY